VIGIEIYGDIHKKGIGKKIILPNIEV